ncbi:hypothetical protein [Pararhizobium sp. A13]|uniref:hypothetical protein n=1 Tax=Pararhizobium sp. A13 TaxID=3133975 RepID=UPI00311B0795
MDSKAPNITRNAVTGRLSRERGEKISAVEGLKLTPRMRRLLDQTAGKPGDERREMIKAQFAKKSA